MARVVKAAAVRQDEILDAAQRLFLERGYEETPIQALIDEVGIAKGTFYHHYASKPALLDALVARTVTQSLELIRPIFTDPTLGAVERLNVIFLRIGAWKADRRALMIEMYRAMHAESNAPLLARMQRDATDAMVPMLASIIADGVGEGVFDTPFPTAAARILLELGISLSRAIGDALLDPVPTLSGGAFVAEVDAYHDAVGRILGAAPGAIQLVDTDLLRTWFPLESTRSP